MEVEAEAIRAAALRLDHNLLQVVELIRKHSGKVVVSGLGKSGHVAQKITATLQSTGTPSVFLHPSEAMHGDLGVCQEQDPVVMISRSRTTYEMLGLVDPLRKMRSPLIGVLGNVDSPLARAMDVVLDASVQREADPGGSPHRQRRRRSGDGPRSGRRAHGSRGFSAGISRYHAGGQLGRGLRMHVTNVMHTGKEVAWMTPLDSLKRVVVESPPSRWAPPTSSPISTLCSA